MIKTEAGGVAIGNAVRKVVSTDNAIDRNISSAKMKIQKVRFRIVAGRRAFLSNQDRTRAILFISHYNAINQQFCTL